MVHVMNCEEATEKVVQSWSRISSAGHATLLETLQVFSPMSKELFSTEKEMGSFIEGLISEGNKPTVLKSKDVYGYRSCTSVPKPVVKINSTLDTVAPKPHTHRKKKGRKSLDKQTDINYALLSAAAKVVLKNQPTIHLTNLSKASLEQTLLFRPQALTQGPTQTPSRIRLTNISGPSTGHTARLQFHTGICTGGLTVPSSHRPPFLSGTSSTPSECAGHSPKTVSLQKVCPFVSRPVSKDLALIGVPAQLQNGRILKESNGMPCWRDQKRRRAEEAEDRRCVKKPRNGLRLVRKQDDSRLGHNNPLRFKVIKVDGTITDEEVRRIAQKILRVNLSPVIEIQPLIVVYPK